MKTTCLLLLALCGTVAAQDLFRTDPPSLAGVLRPHFHATGAVGDSTIDPTKLATHGHDPNNQFALQGIDVGLSLEAGEFVQGFINYNFFLDPDHKWDGEWEEGFLKLVNLPGGFEVRAGRMFNRIGRQNAVHLHGWDFVDANLLTTRFLGDEGLVTNSVELTWLVPTPFESALSVSFGEAVPHDHEHAHGHGHEEEHEGEEHEDEEEHEEGLEGEDGLFDRDIVTVRYEGFWAYNDFHQYRFGTSFVIGDNGFDRTTRALGLDFEYAWLQNGFEPGGCSLRWRTEVMGREVEYQHEDGDDRGRAEEFGVSTALLCGFAEDWTAGLRYGWVSGSDELEELPERHRVSAALTRRWQAGDATDGWVRLQVNHDELEEYGGEQSVWLQFGINWGSPEVR